MRCDGNEPCAPCRSATSDCHYTVSTAPSTTPSISSQVELNNEEAQMFISNGFDTTAAESQRSRSLSFMTQHPALENQPSFDEGMEGLQTYQNPMPLSFPDQTGMPMYGTVIGNEHNTSISLQPDDLLYPVPDPDGLNDFWQMPTMVRTSLNPCILGSMGTEQSILVRWVRFCLER